MMQCTWGIQVSVAWLAACPGGLASRLAVPTADVNKTLKLEDVHVRLSTPAFLVRPSHYGRSGGPGVEAVVLGRGPQLHIEKLIKDT